MGGYEVLSLSTVSRAERASRTIHKGMLAVRRSLPVTVTATGANVVEAVSGLGNTGIAERYIHSGVFPVFGSIPAVYLP